MQNACKYTLSNFTQCVWHFSGPAVPPLNVSVTSTMQGSLSFSWSPPPCSSRGGVIQGYSYLLTERNSNAHVAQSNTTQESVTIYGLVGDTEYQFQVAAFTTAGLGPYSQLINATTLEGLFTFASDCILHLDMCKEMKRSNAQGNEKEKDRQINRQGGTKVKKKRNVR